MGKGNFLYGLCHVFFIGCRNGAVGGFVGVLIVYCLQRVQNMLFVAQQQEVDKSMVVALAIGIYISCGPCF